MGISIQQANSMSYFSNTNQVLRKSSSYNESVVSLQKDLTAIGYSTNGVDGYFGDNTKAAVIAFQNAYGLDVDGIAGSQTLGKINELINGAKATTVAAPKPTVPSDSVSISGNLQMGSKGSAVVDLQEKLIRMGYDCGGYGADGDFGTGTYNSVIRFQKNYGLTEDGVVGTKTSQAIANALKTGNNGVPNYIMNKINTSSTGTNTANKVTSYSQADLSKSMRNVYSSEVEKLQRDLTAFGYSTNGIDGYFGENTEAAVRRFQQDNKLSVDGIAGQKTKSVLYNIITTGSSNSTTGTAFSLNKLSASGTVGSTAISGGSASGTGSSTPSSGVNYTQLNLSKSMVGAYSNEVKKLQEDLVSIGYGVNGIDGYFGNKTDAAVRKFQKDHNLTVDGVAGQNTKNAIVNEIASITGRKLGNNGVPVDIINKINTGSTGYSTPSTATSYSQSNLSKSMVGVYSDEVKKLQEDLVSIGHGVNGIDGYFGDKTDAAVRKFQKDHNLTVDGVAGQNTKNAIVNEIASITGRKLGNDGVPIDLIKTVPITPSVGTSYTENNLSKKMIGVYSNEVKKLQEDLTSLNYSTDGIDGYFGDKTDAAVRKFQQANGLEVDGIAGKNTKSAISNALVSSTDSSTPSSATTKTIEDLYKLDSNSMKNQAIQITVSGNTVKIKAYVNFTGDANEEFGDTGKTYAEIVKEGIQERWTTTFNGSDYDFAKGIKGNVVTEIISMVPGKTYYNNPAQKYIQFAIDTEDESWYDGEFDGIFGDEHISNFKGGRSNWSTSSSKEITLYKCYKKDIYTESRLKGVAAHEFGHALGLGDAYPEANGGKHLVDNNEVTEGEFTTTNGNIMWHNEDVLANDVEMVLEAFKTNEWQYYIDYDGHTKSSVIRIPQEFEEDI